jgi:hypothetical protein
MIGLLICVALLAAVVQFVCYCRSALTSAGKVKLSDHVLEVASMENETLAADDFTRFLELARLCPEHAADRTGMLAVRIYYDLLRALENASRELIPRISSWAERERENCSHFAAVVLDRSITSGRNLFTAHVTDGL